MKPTFNAGKNIAIKVPPHEYDATVTFYRDILGFEQLTVDPADNNQHVTFKFGNNNLWIDKIPGISQAEIWLEVITDDIELASRYMQDQACIRCDEIEPLPEGFKGFWVSSPSNIIHLVNLVNNE